MHARIYVCRSMSLGAVAGAVEAMGKKVQTQIPPFWPDIQDC